MKLHAAVRMGTAHAIYCEDFLIAEGIGEKSLLCAVMDGCSMGKDSHFISALLGKLLRKICQEMSYQGLHEASQSWREEDPQSVAKEVLKRLFHEAKAARNSLMLRPDEMLATLILWIHHYDSERSFIMVVGDGFVSCDGKIHEIDQGNKPDYLGYHLGEKFETWYQGQTQTFNFEHPRDVCIATDGVDTLRRVQDLVGNQEVSPDPKTMLMVDSEFADATNMLDKKLDQMERESALKPIDDLAMIRIIF
ncbi:MAG: protein phosphatase 2C domain-containing protein [Bacteroidota bacterium]